ncbi:C40 family peptidase [Jannaschia ovalis]|uniref:Peptidase n=1 Tax=Jannaschia ovalis TaxID=3038773 RepID=A0ABY8LE76_9RHOB|nr:peptidase [Jannaschia sp. GRR-S6-38]WGH78365.1 peptidase [Jannaschia sp. GRR-S6-38]
MNAVVAAARGWIGTPYLHQASARGAGADCLGLIRGVWRETVGAEPVVPPPYTADWAEPQRDEVLMRAGHDWLHPVPFEDPYAAGQVLLFRMRDAGVAKHLGILTAAPPGDAAFVHAYSGHGVVESPLSDPWRRRIVARFIFPTS